MTPRPPCYIGLIGLPKVQSRAEIRENLNLQQFKVIQGHGANRKHICNFLLVISSNFGHISYCFPRYQRRKL